MKKRKYKYSALQILKRFLKENRDLIKFYYLGPSVREAMKNNCVSIWSSLGFMITQHSYDLNVLCSDLIREYSDGKETYATISNRLHEWNRKRGYYDAMYWDDKVSHYTYVIKRRKLKTNDKESNSHS
jgi:hypothetical protein